MFAIMSKLLLMYFTSLCFAIDSSKELSSNENCYFINDESNVTWKLLWQDNFQSENYFRQNWIIEDDKCYGWKDQASCNVQDNVKLQEGYLVLNANEEKYGQMNFTGAMIRTNRVFGYGRIEARASLSLEKDIRSIFYTGTDRSGDGFLMMHCFEYILKNYQAAVFPNNYVVYERNNLNINYDLFHLYGIEWSENEIKFFVDDHYSEPILLNANRMIQPEQHIRFWYGVIDENASLLDTHNWKCPLWIVDYVRVYEKDYNFNVGMKVELCETQNNVDPSRKKQRELVNSFCGIESKNQNQWKLSWSNINVTFYVAFGIATLLFIIILFLRYRINKMKQTNASSEEIELQNQYETIKYEDVKKSNYEEHNYIAISNE